jgi:hypothetical protein
VAAGARFAVDMGNHPDRYVAGRLPELPFVQASFNLVLSSHLLFGYADRLDMPFHRTAIGKLIEFRAGGSQMLVCQHARSSAYWEDDHVTR